MVLADRNAVRKLPLVQLTAEASGTTATEDAFVRSKAAETVGYYSEDPRVLDELHRLATSDPVEEVRQVAASAHKKYTRKLQYFDKASI
ncbi:MAG TPA: hypothetical protein PL157_08035 [Acidobacteriota bacterium]|nr:hypothetical protein [Acidobacteriota bacterium]